MKNIILASASPRRIEMMKEHNITPEIIPAHITENIPPNISLESVVMFLALKKAMAVREKYLNEKKDFSKGEKKDFLEEEKIIVAADTVVYQNEIMGKPKNKKEAFQMLSSLRGTCHLVATGVAIAETHTLKKKLFCEITKVFFKEYSDEDLLRYIDTPEPYDKAGGYAIQGTFSQYIDYIKGDYDNVIGFPWSRFVKELDYFK